MNSRVGTLTPELQHLAVLEDDALVQASDETAYLATAVATVAGQYVLSDLSSGPVLFATC